ncbi:MAG: hypothetical protein KDC53_00845, partial [Saprospiraceae bacterium]|nr:hypothetical protein [Saprospiraceae bacterium]
MAKRKPSLRSKSVESNGRSQGVTKANKPSHYWAKDIRLSTVQQKRLLYISLGITLLMALLSTRVGLNGDDDVQARYSSSIPSFYSSMGRDTSCFSSGPEIKYYGALFEIATGFTNKVLGNDMDEPAYYQVRHVWNAIFGGVAMFFLALFIGQVAGFEAALISLGLIFFSMRFLGHSLFNPKDIPFAAGYMVSIYFIYMILRSMPKLERSSLIGMSAGIAMSVGVRIGGVLVIGYLGLFLALYFIWCHGITTIFTKLAKPYYRAFFIPALFGTAVALLVWPFGLMNPLQNIPAALDAFANFQYAIKVLFNDQQVWSSEIPIQYLLTWILITVPVFTLVGIVLFLVFAKSLFTRYNFIPLILSIFAFSFPIIYVLSSHSILYDGWRHFMFTYPPLLVLVTLTWNHFLQITRAKRNLHLAVWSVLALTAVDSAIFLVRNSEFPYTYFNPLVGGIKGAYGSYELDYWGTSVKQCVEALEKQGVLHPGLKDTVTIGTNFSHAVQVYTHKYGDLVKVNYVRWRQRNDRPWEYGIFVNRFVDGSYLKKGYWPTSKTIESVEVNGRPIAIIEKDGMDSPAYKSAQAIVRQDWSEAVIYSEQEVQEHPDDEMSWINLGMAYLNLEEMEKAKVPLEKALEIVPDNQNALNFMGYFYFAIKNLERAAEIFQKAVQLHQTDVTAYYYLARIAYERQNYTQALEYAHSGIDYDTRNPLCYQIAAESYYALGDRV